MGLKELIDNHIAASISRRDDAIAPDMELVHYEVQSLQWEINKRISYLLKERHELKARIAQLETQLREKQEDAS